MAELVGGRRAMAAEIRDLALRVEAMPQVRWWLLRPLLHDSVRVLCEVTELDPVSPIPQSLGEAPQAPRGR